jgi:CSLREA domain-containing protein
LYASAREGASFTFADYGQEGSPPNPCGDPPVPVGGKQTAPGAQSGALRSQDLRTNGDPVALDGTIIRINPDTGMAMPDNPLIGNSDLNARKIIAYGLRNPFRFVIRPGTSEIWVGDVGLSAWEEINRIADPSDSTVENFGWPCYEGSARQPGYDGLNLTLCENLYAQPWAVTMPYFQYRHGTAIIPGENCPTGSSSISGVVFSFYPGGPYPADYDGALFFADYSRNCIWVMFKGSNGLPNPLTVSTFVTSAAGPIDLQIGPDGNLYYVDFNGGTVRRIQYTGSTSTLPSPWLNRDVGGVAATGSASYADGTFTVRASGADIWGTSDEFHYVHQPLNGNGVITARVTSLANTNSWAKARVMIRETLNANAKHVTTVITPRQGVSFQRRSSTGGSSASKELASVTAPEWVRLKRSGNAFTAWHSSNGTSWTQVGSATVSMGTDVYAGLAVTSHNDGAVTTAKFDNVRITKSLPPTPTISSPATSLTWKVGDTINFSGSATDAEDGALPASALTWTIIMRHCPSSCHTHTVQTFTGRFSGSFSAPDHEYPSSLEIRLTAKDLSGTENTKSVIINPKTVPLTLRSSPSGLRLGFNGTTAPSSFTKTVIVNSQNSINAPTPQTLSGTAFVFSSWSDGGAASHNIRAPASAITYTATFTSQTSAAGARDDGVEFSGVRDASEPGTLGRDQPALALGPAAQPGVTKPWSGIREAPTRASRRQESSRSRNHRVHLTDTAGTEGGAAPTGYRAGRIFTVNSTADAEDRMPGDGVCDAGGGTCTLRAALTESEFGGDEAPPLTAVYFDIPEPRVPTIRIREDVSFNLGSLRAPRPVIIDGTTQPAGLVELDGSEAVSVDSAGRPIVGLDLSGQGSKVRGLVINRFPSHGIHLRPDVTPIQDGVTVEGNLIGSDVTGTVALPNGGDGVHISQRPNTAIVGNVIVGNAGHGVAVEGGEATGNQVLRNIIHGNDGLGIVLSDYANQLQEPPVLTSIVAIGGILIIQGALTGIPNTTFTLEFFANSMCHSSGFGEGESILGSAEVTTRASGPVGFSVALPANMARGQHLTATATDPAGSTSEFSRCASVVEASSVLPPGTFAAKAEITRGPRAGDDAFTVKATLPLGLGPNGVAPLMEAVHLRVDTFAVVLPPGSFKEDTQGQFTFEGVLDGAALTVMIRPLVGGIVELKVDGIGADLSGTVNPLTVHLTVGDEGGSMDVIADIK